MKIAAALVASAVLAVPLAAAAQPGLTDPVVPPPPVDESGDKSPGLALGLSLLGTAAGCATLVAAANTEEEGLWLLGLGGLVVGPSLGHFYAGEVGRGVNHSVVRVGASVVILAGALVTFADCWDADEAGSCGGVGPAVMIGGAVLGIGSTLYSIVDSPGAASRHNEARRKHRFVVTPVPVVGPDRSTGYGVALGAQF